MSQNTPWLSFLLNPFRPRPLPPYSSPLAAAVRGSGQYVSQYECRIYLASPPPPPGVIDLPSKRSSGPTTTDLGSWAASNGRKGSKGGGEGIGQIKRKGGGGGGGENDKKNI